MKKSAQSILEIGLLLALVAIISIVTITFYNQSKLNIVQNKINSIEETTGETAGILGYTQINENQININGTTCTIIDQTLGFNFIKNIFNSSNAAYASSVEDKCSASNPICNQPPINGDLPGTCNETNPEGTCTNYNSGSTSLNCGGINYIIENGIINLVQ